MVHHPLALIPLLTHLSFKSCYSILQNNIFSKVIHLPIIVGIGMHLVEMCMCSYIISELIYCSLVHHELLLLHSRNIIIHILYTRNTDAHFKTLQYVPLFDLCLEQELSLSYLFMELYLESTTQVHNSYNLYTANINLQEIFYSSAHYYLQLLSNHTSKIIQPELLHYGVGDVRTYPFPSGEPNVLFCPAQPGVPSYLCGFFSSELPLIPDRQ